MKGFSSLSLALVVLLLAGCAAPNQVRTPVDSGVETVAFITDAERVNVVDVATAVLVRHDFTITLANERLGLLQTDYTSVAGIEAMRADSGNGHPSLDELYLRVTVNTDDQSGGRVVQVKGNFQRMDGGRAPDRLLGLYWMERLVEDMANGLDADYVNTVSAETYNLALGNAAVPTPGRSRDGQLGRGLRAVGIVGAVLFAATLAAGVLAPSGSR